MQNVEPITTSDRVSKLLGIDLSAEVLAYYDQHASLPGAGGWRHVAEVLGTSKGAAYGMAHGTQSWTVGAAARWINHRHTNTLTVPACPDCGSVHHARCHGNGGEAVVLAPGETVRRPRGPWQSKAKPEVAAMVRGLERALERKQGRSC